ncbi:MAG: RNA polymerase sigma factor RpoD/SigA [Spirochaetaceae bacterium]|jgi:RNA polymerase primary sigma factor|nr:RNA polymerase sigma factor RpoD/SigA [Spirochaetaceae bacterium]
MNREIFKSYMAQSKRYPPLSGDEEAELSRRIHAGDESARQTLVLSNLRLVISIARKFHESGLSLMDLIQEGNLGLTVAASRYHYSYHTRFSTYAYAWIAQYILRYILSKSPVIAVPHRKSELIRQIQAARNHLLQQKGSPPGTREIADYLNMPVKLVARTLKFVYTVTSLDVELESFPGLTLGDFVPDPCLTPEALVLRSMEAAQVTTLLSELPRIERKIIYLRYNFGGAEKKTLREIGILLGISAEAVRQTERRALARLKQICLTRGIKAAGMTA